MVTQINSPEDAIIDPGACWIWSRHTSRPYNNVLAFRRTFHVEGHCQAALQKITADSRYDLFVNGSWLGQGPARSFPTPWPVDSYDLRAHLKRGKNVIAVLVQHWGISTFQYIHDQAGLIAQLDWHDLGGAHRLCTSPDWRCRSNEGYHWPVPRLSCMQAWEEQFDARRFPDDWTESSFADEDWPIADAGAPAGSGAHASLVLRDIPMLTRDPVAPVCVRSIEAVRPAPYVWSLNPRDYLNALDKSANFLRGQMLLITHIYSDVGQKVSLHPPHARPGVQWKLNGRLLNFSDQTLQKTDTGVAHAGLECGQNTLMGLLPVEEHYWWAVLNLWTDQPVQFSASPSRETGAGSWLAVGPFAPPRDPPDEPLTANVNQIIVDADHFAPGATAAEFNRLWQLGWLDAQSQNAAFVRPLTRDLIADEDVYARCASERVVAGVAPRVDDLHALLSDSEDWTTIHPAGGADVRLLLDFGREVVGFHEFEIDAPAGTILDNHNFEFIQPDGRLNLAEGMNNSFRYVCREGAQRYRTLLRRGFQYSWLSFRSFSRPIRVRFVRVLMSTYPQARQGSFACSDPLLEQIWQAGIRSVECCSEDTYTDCPTYEQTFWVGDGRNEALVDLIANGDPRLSAHCLELAGQSLQRSPLVESQVPSGWQNILPAWSFLWMRWAQEHFQLTGDRDLARRLLGPLGRNIQGMRSCLSERHLLRIRGWNMFDWAAMDTPSGGEVTHVNCLAVLGLRQAARLARDLDDIAQAAEWSGMADHIADAVNQHLWDEHRQAYIDCIRPDGQRSEVFSQQTQTAAYIAGVPVGSRAARCQTMMTAPPAGFVTAGSPFFMFFLLEALANDGEDERMVRTIRDYWGQQIRAGATTFWETYHPGQPRLTRSHCHGWSAAPTFFLTQQVLGIRPLEPGYSVVHVRPRPSGLTWARGRVPTPHGIVECSWSTHPQAFSLRLVLPQNVCAFLDLPIDGVPMLRAGRWMDDGSSTRGLVSGPLVEVTVSV